MMRKQLDAALRIVVQQVNTSDNSGTLRPNIVINKVIEYRSNVRLLFALLTFLLCSYFYIRVATI